MQARLALRKQNPDKEKRHNHKGCAFLFREIPTPPKKGTHVEICGCESPFARIPCLDRFLHQDESHSLFDVVDIAAFEQLCLFV